MSNAKLHMLDAGTPGDVGACERSPVKHAVPMPIFGWFASKYPKQTCAECSRILGARTAAAMQAIAKRSDDADA